MENKFPKTNPEYGKKDKEIKTEEYTFFGTSSFCIWNNLRSKFLLWTDFQATRIPLTATSRPPTWQKVIGGDLLVSLKVSQEHHNIQH